METEPERLVVVTKAGFQADRLIAEPLNSGESSIRSWIGIFDEQGQDLAEYAILIGLIALVVIGTVTLFGTQLVAAYNGIIGQLPFGGGS